MAKPLPEISKTDFRNHYNIVEVSNDIDLIMKTLQTFNPNNQAVAFGARKQHKLTIDEKLDLIMSEIKNIKVDVNAIKTRLDNIVKLNNLKE